MKPPSAAAYEAALERLGRHLTPTRLRLLQVHLAARGRQLTMTQLASAMGWKNYSSANVHYGKLAELVGREVRFPYRRGECHLTSLCTFRAPEEAGDHWLIILRPEVAEALENRKPAPRGRIDVPTPARALPGRPALRNVHSEFQGSPPALASLPPPAS